MFFKLIAGIPEATTRGERISLAIAAILIIVPAVWHLFRFR